MKRKDRIIDAVSLVFTCGSEIFTVKRQNFLRAFPGYTAFPGGKVDDDESVESYQCSHLSQIEARLARAMVREANEELGFDIEKACETDLISSIDLLGLAVTPDFNPYRYATFFYKIALKSKPKFIVDTNEAFCSEWQSSAKLMHAFNQGEILAVPPIIHVLLELGRDISLTQLPGINFDYDPEQIVPYIESIKGVWQFMPKSNTLPPADRTNAFYLGDENSRRILIDPSPANDHELEKLEFSLAKEKFNIDAIFLTHHHGDHLERSDILARKWGVPMYMSQDTFDRLTKKRGASFFNNIDVVIAKEGDEITHWLGEPVNVYALPGHDLGHLGLAPISMKWFIVGDLFQGVGTVVVGGEEGNMTKYMESLEKVIKLNPQCVFPSHGIALGGTNILQKTLMHRKLREEQILSLAKAGKNFDQMLEEIYFDLPDELSKYAKKNIEAHYDKLVEEGRV
jgi:glyoxylase-like metal-dependent hydrolase (beta-lactamase superfamily II)/8-oxo-dGTP pyrophosphatase MutT (NUDIX family)